MLITLVGKKTDQKSKSTERVMFQKKTSQSKLFEINQIKNIYPTK